MGSEFPKGVRPRQNDIQIWFIWGKKRCFEALPWKPTPANIRRAGNLRSEIARRIRYDAFNWTEYRAYFPESENLPALVVPEFQDMAQYYLDGLETSSATRNEYRKALQRYWMPAFGLTPVDQIKTSDIRARIKEIDFRSNKTRNNALIPLRKVFDLALEDELINSNPGARIKNLKHQKPLPDPLTADEQDAILNQLRESEKPVFWAYFGLAFHSGLRNPSELTALMWPSVDLRSRQLRVKRKNSRGTIKDETKTGVIRDVILPEAVDPYLVEIRSQSYLAGGHVFINPTTGDRFVTGKALNAVWNRTLKKLGIRHRDMRQTRHTCATQWLMAGMNPQFVAKQLGHSVMMTLNVYSKWIDQQGDQREIAKAAAPECAENVLGSTGGSSKTLK